MASSISRPGLLVHSTGQGALSRARRAERPPRFAPSPGLAPPASKGRLPARKRPADALHGRSQLEVTGIKIALDGVHLVAMHRRRGPQRCMAASAFLICTLLPAIIVVEAAAPPNEPPKPGGAGYALVFHGTPLLKESFEDFPTDAFTFEAWISTSDNCKNGTLFSYASKSKPDDKDFDEFVIFKPTDLLACHYSGSLEVRGAEMDKCFKSYTTGLVSTPQGKFVSAGTDFSERTGAWNHLAVTWEAANEGVIRIYMNGLQVSHSESGRTKALPKNGILSLGGNQGCYGGCHDPGFSYYGMMDEVRIWKTARSQTDILQTMSKAHVDHDEDLVAYWKFDDADWPHFHGTGTTKDWSGDPENTLDLLKIPTMEEVNIKGKLSTGALKFMGNYAMNQSITNMPKKDITIEFWARAPVVNDEDAEILSFAAAGRQSGGDTDETMRLLDDAIRIRRYQVAEGVPKTDDTKGSISVHINSNPDRLILNPAVSKLDDRVDFQTRWTDDKWHHVAVSWESTSGDVSLRFDGEDYIAFWNRDEQYKDPKKGGVSSSIGKRFERESNGSLVIGQNQECMGGCFQTSKGFNGQLAALRIWNRILTTAQVKENMFKVEPSDAEGLVIQYDFSKSGITGERQREKVARDQRGGHSDLQFGSIAPSYQLSYAPLTDSIGRPLPLPTAGASGYALQLHDQQVLMIERFENFPSHRLTVEFWMWSIDTCRQGAPFSYGHGDFNHTDNEFVISNSNNWGISVLEHDGGLMDHNAGVGSNDGRWHHIAVSWESATGEVLFYDNSKLTWVVQRAGQNKSIPSGGALVIGREQDCLGGCFDSAFGAAGQVTSEREYGAQDFFGVIDEMRIWKTVRTPEQIYKGMVADTERGAGLENNFIDPKDENLVAYWKFDEGNGYNVKDVTDNKHTLRMTQEPKWKVVRWLSTCGDKLLEGTEQCDDGNRKGGDGCSSTCEVEEGWHCSQSSPSLCQKVGTELPAPASKPKLPSEADVPKADLTKESKPGDAGLALVFHNNAVVRKDFQNAPTDELTFEAWISTSDFCHKGAILSYAVPAESTEYDDVQTAANSFVIYNSKDLLACHDFEYIVKSFDTEGASCRAHFNNTIADPSNTDLTDNTGKWHHLAVSWEAAKNGSIQIYIDGLPVAKSVSGQTKPLKSGGQWILGAEQDCLGGCTDPAQAFYGLMDEVRIWRTVRNQTAILDNMRRSGDRIEKDNLVAYWTFDDVGTSESRAGGTSLDRSGNGNDLVLHMPPTVDPVTIHKVENSGSEAGELTTDALHLTTNSYALGQNTTNMPTEDITIEFWAKSPVHGQQHEGELFSFVTPVKDSVNEEPGRVPHMHEAIRIQHVMNGTADRALRGAIRVHFNDEVKRSGGGEHWVMFYTHWNHDMWHHICVTWEFSTGNVTLWFDGHHQQPSAVSLGGDIRWANESDSGRVDPSISQRAQRSEKGSLVLGQKQQCLAGCFSEPSAFDGHLANVRVWSRLLLESQVKANMFTNDPEDKSGLAMAFKLVPAESDKRARAVDSTGDNNLVVDSIAPSYQYSDVPLISKHGKPAVGPSSGFSGYSLQIHSQQVLISPEFKKFPSEAITIEFWIWSIDTCRTGVPISYAHESNVDAFVISNYNDWHATVMGDEGPDAGTSAGLTSTDGRWHHIAVTWESDNGKLVLYDNGRVAWRAVRAKGQKLPSGGTVVIGSAQGCVGGCLSTGINADQNGSRYGPSDFIGVIDEMRIWSRTLRLKEILEGMSIDQESEEQGAWDKRSTGLVAHWKFDEGVGKVVKDSSKNGNDLLLREENWKVSRWVVCGDGILEGTEECDDGNKASHDGCSKVCTVEQGYICSFTSPSECLRPDGGKVAQAGSQAPESKLATPPPESPEEAAIPTQEGLPKPGEAKYSLVFQNNVFVKKDFKDFPTEELTFEAWISTSDSCTSGAIMSYSKKGPEDSIKTDSNHFVIFDQQNILACHDYKNIDALGSPADVLMATCRWNFKDEEDIGQPTTDTFVDPNGGWHHLAVTWKAADNGKTYIYKDGLQVAVAETKHTDPLDPNGVFMLGGEQDCFGGCTQGSQAFYGMMDEVRIWNTVRTKEQIFQFRRKTGSEVGKDGGLVAYWKFDNLGEGTQVAHDSSGKGNDLSLLADPEQLSDTISKQNLKEDLGIGALKFTNSYAVNRTVVNMPSKSFSIEFWAKSNLRTSGDVRDHETILSYVTKCAEVEEAFKSPTAEAALFARLHDEIRIDHYSREYNGHLEHTDISTQGAMSVVMSYSKEGVQHHSWVDFPTNWTDEDWHHIAVSWDFDSGSTELHFDGDRYTPFWLYGNGRATNQDPNKGGTSNVLAQGIERNSSGVLVVGQRQSCVGGCFSPSAYFDGYLANLRIWDKVLSDDQIKSSRATNQPGDTPGLVMMYDFNADSVVGSGREAHAVDTKGGSNLLLRSIAPPIQYSDAPLVDANGKKLAGPTLGSPGYALKFDDAHQGLYLGAFEDFPTTAITVEFWLWTIDKCGRGAPFAYTVGKGKSADNGFAVFNYNSWGVAVMNDEGGWGEAKSSVGAADGRWHHVAVTWESETGNTELYDNGIRMWSRKRAKGKRILSGGMLTVGKRQDCEGKCAKSAASDTSPILGFMDELRIWKRVRSQEEIWDGMAADVDRAAGGKKYHINLKDDSLVAYWNFNEEGHHLAVDLTGHEGHSLGGKGERKVVRMFSRCGDGIQEGPEQCDDGNTENGDGCASDCLVEEGWLCTQASPSDCVTKEGYSSAIKLQEATGGSKQAELGGRNSSAGTLALVVIAVTVLAIIVGIISYKRRGAIYRRFPRLRRWVTGQEEHRYEQLQTMGDGNRHGV
ncbi:unnamed protein product [Ostreobium quekettii]|uniref:Pentraxin (PTX) domain-containing protein n=1 Tax=Ostreobium quekettii TaxID=121088 RepID=A0A8S1J1N3_9CHLO|nr:unnamed protein product [Ostreobium quekettii]